MKKWIIFSLIIFLIACVALVIYVAKDNNNEGEYGYLIKNGNEIIFAESKEIKDKSQRITFCEGVLKKRNDRDFDSNIKVISKMPSSANKIPNNTYVKIIISKVMETAPVQINATSVEQVNKTNNP
ncbi:hypothetical protein [Listeria booriae]|uniref:hypothetical protein n=1 Tax=Listeria booriae TaxID=1552123 RepID=UPI0016265441|nr:hypothetical protein [Listeria booriae]MBC2149135.1 hypothetical protein [Listeria booriae]MBC2193801.1 hypothetical protein [Listeria booriae]